MIILIMMMRLLSEDELIGGIPVIDRVDSIQDKIDKIS